MENIKRLKNDLNTFILKLMDKKASKDEIKILPAYNKYHPNSTNPISYP